MSVCDFVRSPTYWEALCRACQRKSESIPNMNVPILVGNMPLVNNYDDVRGVMLEAMIDANGGRCLIFILWLRRHPESYRLWRCLVQDFPQVWTRALCQLALL